MVIKNMAYYKAKHKASALKYRAPQANQTLVQGEKEAGKTTGGSVFTRAAQGVAKNIKATKDMVKEKVVDAAISSVKPV
jgi:hypothetical protein